MARNTVKLMPQKPSWFSHLKEETKQHILGVIFAVIAIILILSSIHFAGLVGNWIYWAFYSLFGWGYFFIILFLIFESVNLFRLQSTKKVKILTLVGSLILILSVLGILHLLSEGKGGLVGQAIGYIRNYLGIMASFIILVASSIIGILILFNRPILRPVTAIKERFYEQEIKEPEKTAKEKAKEEKEEKQEELEIKIKKPEPSKEKIVMHRPGRAGVFELPPLELLEKESDRPSSGDIKANANIIKRTLEDFGIPVEMGEINIGPTVTQYTLKPAQGVKLSKITTLQNDLSLALAAHPIRIEAPIPGKSLVGIEVPNKSAALVRLGNLLANERFLKANHLTFTLGRDVTGGPVYDNLSKMPHLLIAGTTGSGKSVFIHSILLGFLFKNTPEILNFILIDPKRVELSVYNNIPHLLSPVITEGKKAVAAMRWLTKEMERRYDTLLAAGSRDIESYNKNRGEKLPYIVLVIDELADLMAAYGREVEGSIVRLAQMSRATGIHLIVSTQRPSVEVITGLIKANIPARIAFQLISQVDSRTILDMAGAEKLLGSGDMLYLSPDSSKPKRMQGPYVSEKETKRVAEFWQKQSGKMENQLKAEIEQAEPQTFSIFDEVEESEEDELYPAAYKLVIEAGKASASYLQRRLKIGYARAARLLDILEAKGIIGPGEGAKPREVLVRGSRENTEDEL